MLTLRPIELCFHLLHFVIVLIRLVQESILMTAKSKLMILLTNIDQFQALLDSKSDFIIYKHSSTCNISDKACRNVYQIVNELQLNNVYHLDVHQTGDLKYEVADTV